MLSCDGEEGAGDGGGGGEKGGSRSAEFGLVFVALFINLLTSFKPKYLIFPTRFTLGP